MEKIFKERSEEQNIQIQNQFESINLYFDKILYKKYKYAALNKAQFIIIKNKIQEQDDK